MPSRLKGIPAPTVSPSTGYAITATPSPSNTSGNVQPSSTILSTAPMRSQFQRPNAASPRSSFWSFLPATIFICSIGFTQISALSPIVIPLVISVSLYLSPFAPFANISTAKPTFSVEPLTLIPVLGASPPHDWCMSVTTSSPEFAATFQSPRPHDPNVIPSAIAAPATRASPVNTEIIFFILSKPPSAQFLISTKHFASCYNVVE